MTRGVTDRNATDYVWNKAGIDSKTAGSSVTTFTHDEFGRMTGRSGAATATYGWDARSELATVVSGESTVTFAYDTSRLPARRVETTSGGSDATEYYWSGGKLAAERFSDGSVYRYSYRPDGAPLELVAVDASGTAARYGYHLDPLGNVVGLTDETGSQVAQYEYDPHGVAISSVGIYDDPLIRHRNPLRYRGYFWDEGAELYILPARVYDPSIARFLSVDPVPHKLGQPQSGNSYAYCEGNPVAFVDPQGKDILLGNYYDTPQDQFEPDIPQQDGQPGGGVGPSPSRSCHTPSSSGQRERAAALKRLRDLAEGVRKGQLASAGLHQNVSSAGSDFGRKDTPVVNIGVSGGFISLGVIVSASPIPGGSHASQVHPYIGLGPRLPGASVTLSGSTVSHGINLSASWFAPVPFGGSIGAPLIFRRGSSLPIGIRISQTSTEGGIGTPGFGLQLVHVF